LIEWIKSHAGIVELGAVAFTLSNVLNLFIVKEAARPERRAAFGLG